ncbi:hypothetical protein VIBNISFn27_550068 [Vibrio nigripulchritudo SFn27]|uniref:Uncharacterized protein n=1 Tax=Vibrio nigripulchritudo TaxID=28173 RepID=U4KFI8_9VIBR|nr:zinc ribbon domain-containing protein [Vibrio nigripulchritudo]CCN85490.1 hypothetical protein VIBNIBLFn1_940027 [Vibrio nigripulchritudo BLFn1]CCN89041.1 hypothetical protein VIBNISFn27_550068 [Vibrio nigripulchritudo SFn27]CCN95459.1 hypothetical protein VIBNIENn2_570027 [Vibrio nigripulchritudo ENn2]CCO43216.1 hypothetical protein VIBNISFn135_940028 [Vibrio nigripulchritudo SFn135]CCO54498.1 hypothetical protein VIBNIWn13_70067 [Vibrio nigripulchritudo Wn13]
MDSTKWLKVLLPLVKEFVKGRRLPNRKNKYCCSKCGETWEVESRLPISEAKRITNCTHCHSLAGELQFENPLQLESYRKAKIKKASEALERAGETSLDCVMKQALIEAGKSLKDAL